MCVGHECAHPRVPRYGGDGQNGENMERPGARRRYEEAGQPCRGPRSRTGQIWDVGANFGARKVFGPRLAEAGRKLRERTTGGVIGVAN
ncbi:hypothetical protein EDB84DRAFT_1488756, partial [Lactarius hengduanensis]